jgi:zinc finger protein
VKFIPLTLISQSETSGLTIPEIDLILQPGTLGGRFTTLEGILDQVYEELSEKVFTTGDSSTTGLEDKDEFEGFLSKLKEVRIKTTGSLKVGKS